MPKIGAIAVGWNIALPPNHKGNEPTMVVAVVSETMVARRIELNCHHCD